MGSVRKFGFLLEYGTAIYVKPIALHLGLIFGEYGTAIYVKPIALHLGLVFGESWLLILPRIDIAAVRGGYFFRCYS